jgi:hypothetical protein
MANEPFKNYDNENDYDPDVDCDFEEVDENLYYDPVPFKSYDEILAARKRTKTARRGALIGFLVLFLLLIRTLALCYKRRVYRFRAKLQGAKYILNLP